MGPVASVVLLFASGAAAQFDPARYAAILDGCHAAAESAEALADCKGRVADACMAMEPDGQTTLGMSGCLTAEARLWDRLLNLEWRAAMDWAKTADETESEYFGGQFSGRAEALLEAQRAWLAFRDAECALAYAEWGAGSMRHIAAASCMSDVVAARTVRLRALHEER